MKIPAREKYYDDRQRLPDRLAGWLFGRERAPVPSYIGLIEDPPKAGAPPKTGICCSGGGIRSAAFNLGALQAVQSAGRLRTAKYLSAVSGGAYIAAALSMVAKTPDPDDDNPDDSDPQLVNAAFPPFYHGSPEEQYLRNRSSYLAPGGIGIARFVLRVALGLFVNLCVLTLGLVVIAWCLAQYYRWFHGPLQAAGGKVAAGIQPAELVVAGVSAGLALCLGVASVFLRSTSDRLRRSLETLTLYGFLFSLVVLFVAVAVPALIAALRNHHVVSSESQLTKQSTRRGAGIAAAGSFVSLLTAVLLELRAKLSVDDLEKVETWYRKLGSRARRAIGQVGAWLLGPLLLISIAFIALLAMVSAHHISTLGIIVVGTLFFVMWFFSDVTTWSLHPFYRRRLCTAFALKRVPAPDPAQEPLGRAVERNYHKVVPLSKSGITPDSETWPTLIVCAAANVSDAAATPPGRSVTSFTFSAQSLGGPLVGGISTPAFEDRLASRIRDFTLPAAVAMSGAAVSPSMGKDTRRALRLLLAMANVRLGVWVPNPRRVDRWTERTPYGSRRVAERVHEHDMGRVTTPLVPGDRPPQHEFRRRYLIPRPRPWYLLKEMFGWNSVNDAYLYVTDGGHYENLGLVELLRRGCTEIFCFDASGGRRLDALGDAIALARTELNVEIGDIDPSPLREDDERLAEKCCVSARIRYPNGQEGILIYARAVVTKSAPYDVQAFRIRDPAFPHHSTLDQLYTDQKFEAYRELGFRAGQAALGEAADAARRSNPPLGSPTPAWRWRERAALVVNTLV